MTVEPSTNNNHNKMKIKKILVPIDGSEWSLRAAKYAIKLAKAESAELFCIHTIGSLPYDYTDYPPAMDQYLKDQEEKAQSWFDKVRTVAKNEGIPKLMIE